MLLYVYNQIGGTTMKLNRLTKNEILKIVFRISYIVLFVLSMIALVKSYKTDKIEIKESVSNKEEISKLVDFANKNQSEIILESKERKRFMYPINIQYSKDLEHLLISGDSDFEKEIFDSKSYQAYQELKETQENNGILVNLTTNRNYSPKEGLEKELSKENHKSELKDRNTRFYVEFINLP